MMAKGMKENSIDRSNLPQSTTVVVVIKAWVGQRSILVDENMKDIRSMKATG